MSKGDANWAMAEAAKILGETNVDEFPHSRLALKAGEFVAEFRAWQRREYPYDKLDPQVKAEVDSQE